MKLLFTGCAISFGLHLCQELLKLRSAVVGIDNINKYYDINLKKVYKYEIAWFVKWYVSY